MRESRSLYDLEPSFARLVGEWLRLCSSQGVAVLVYCTARSASYQDELYAQGRTTPGRVVTNARGGQSAHNYGLAIDAAPWTWDSKAPFDVHNRKLDWSPFDGKILDPAWRVMVDSAVTVGLEWAGDWVHFKEYVHFQHPQWKDLKDAMLQLRV